MFKNIIIGLLAISTGVFMLLAIRNATPLSCYEVLKVDESQVCIVKMQGQPSHDLQAVVSELKISHYKY